MQRVRLYLSDNHIAVSVFGSILLTIRVLPFLLLMPLRWVFLMLCGSFGRRAAGQDEQRR